MTRYITLLPMMAVSPSVMTFKIYQQFTYLLPEEDLSRHFQ